MGNFRKIITPLHLSTKRNYLYRMNNNKVKCMNIAQKYSKDYWDGNRKYGYGGYKYIPGRWSSVAKKLISIYRLNSESKVLDVGRTAGYTVYDIFAGFEPTPNLRLSIGMANITDKRYATHLNTTNRLDGAADRTDEPGRTLFGSINYDF